MLSPFHDLPCATSLSASSTSLISAISWSSVPDVTCAMIRSRFGDEATCSTSHHVSALDHILIARGVTLIMNALHQLRTKTSREILLHSDASRVRQRACSMLHKLSDLCSFPERSRRCSCFRYFAYSDVGNAFSLTDGQPGQGAWLWVLLASKVQSILPSSFRRYRGVV